MKEELEKLGFKLDDFGNYLFRLSDYRSICVYIDSNDVQIEDEENCFNTILLFKYNHEKIKQLIKLLS